MYVLRNTVTGRVLLASAPDLREFGIEAFALEVLDVLDVTPEMTPADVQGDLRALEELWREKLGDAPHYQDHRGTPGSSTNAFDQALADLPEYRR